MSRSKTARSLSSLMTGVLAASVLAACSPTTSSPEANVNPVNTGTLESESEYGVLAPSQSYAGAKAYIASEQARARKSPEIKDDNIAGTLLMNDQIEIVDANRIGNDEFIRVRVVDSQDQSIRGKKVYVSAKYLNPTPTQRLSASTSTSELEGSPSHFVITNVATEMVRLYRRCVAPEACKNKMLMEFHGTAGNNSDGMRSDVGVYKTTSWTKFYEVPGEYPAWYRPGYPKLPPVGSRGGWISDSAKPPGFTGFRGAFGWYTVFVGPNNDGQWMHGTSGWGADKSSMVRFQDSFLGGIAGIFAKLGSHGCTRMSNEAIAYMRSNLPVGATYIKIYAQERVKDESLNGYPAAGDLGHFPYILTTLGYGKSNTQHQTASAADVIAAGTDPKEYLDHGTFDYDQTPTAMDGDHYKLHSFSGYFNVDEGTLSSNYRHPVSKKLTVGGYPGRESALPSFVRDTDAPTAPTSRPSVETASDD